MTEYVTALTDAMRDVDSDFNELIREMHRAKDNAATTDADRSRLLERYYELNTRKDELRDSIAAEIN